MDGLVSVAPKKLCRITFELNGIHCYDGVGTRAWGKTEFSNLHNEWLSDRLVSAYSFNGSDRDKGMYVVEAIAEGFLDVEMRGDQADELSKIIHRIVVEEARKRRQAKLEEAAKAGGA